MNVKDWIKELEKQSPNDEVILWRWTDRGACWIHLGKLLPHKHPKGFYEIGIVETMLNIYDRSKLESIVKED